MYIKDWKVRKECRQNKIKYKDKNTEPKYYKGWPIVTEYKYLGIRYFIEFIKVQKFQICVIIYKLQ